MTPTRLAPSAGGGGYPPLPGSRTPAGAAALTLQLSAAVADC